MGMFVVAACSLLIWSRAVGRSTGSASTRRASTALSTYYITNSMFNETKLNVAAPVDHRAKKRRTIAPGCGITYKKPLGRFRI